MRKYVLLLGLSALAWIAKADCPSWPTSSRFESNNASGDEVVDKRTNLIWKRCSQGMIWSNNTCTKDAMSTTAYTHEAALTAAQSALTAAQNATPPIPTPPQWRLPTVKELAGLVDDGCQNPAIDSSAFPGTASTSYWSSTPDVVNPVNAWHISFADGTGGTFLRSTMFAVRLVRDNN